MAGTEIAAQSPFVEDLTAREIEILTLMAEGLSNLEIADRLVLSINTVKWYARQIYGKLGVKGRRAAVTRARDLGLLGSSPGRKEIQHNLPGPTTAFVGREMELHQLDEWLADRACRLVTLVGPGGIGKTRLGAPRCRTTGPGPCGPLSRWHLLRPFESNDGRVYGRLCSEWRTAIRSAERQW